ncbi:hypothetical protein [Prosthecodimorpha staleyi]|uniref:Uncharacterized protein n=1 Tax=Prosthecodimorpha staleyi TaxID=2840188 RepID=A0A947GA74_9HYPH|nr:hypothetical protein [Prosthecodimorpha staleyi]MBT9288798.1 hypothetical protein [Prosthecodimorpha staleyi]
MRKLSEILGVTVLFALAGPGIGAVLALATVLVLWLAHGAPVADLEAVAATPVVVVMTAYRIWLVPAMATGLIVGIARAAGAGRRPVRIAAGGLGAVIGAGTSLALFGIGQPILAVPFALGGGVAGWLAGRIVAPRALTEGEAVAADRAAVIEALRYLDHDRSTIEAAVDAAIREAGHGATRNDLIRRAAAGLALSQPGSTSS